MSPSRVHRFNAVRHQRGAIGCGLSHIAVLEMAIAENWDNVFIAEDDLTWTEHFTTGYDILEDLIRTEYDVIVLGGSFVKSYKNSFKLISCNCALAYIVNNSYYKPLLECFKKGVDGLLNTYNQSQYAIDQIWKPLQRRDNWYIIKPNMCAQLPSYSNIENGFKDYTVYFNKSVEYEQFSASQPVNKHVNPIDYTNLFNSPTLTNKVFKSDSYVFSEPDRLPERVVFNSLNISNKVFNPVLSEPDISFYPTINKNINPHLEAVIQHDTLPERVMFNGPTISNSIFNPHLEAVIQHDTLPERVVFNPPNLSNKIFNRPPDVVTQPIRLPPPPRIVSFKTLLNITKTN